MLSYKGKWECHVVPSWYRSYDYEYKSLFIFVALNTNHSSFSSPGKQIISARTRLRDNLRNIFSHKYVPSTPWLIESSKFHSVEDDSALLSPRRILANPTRKQVTPPLIYMHLLINISRSRQNCRPFADDTFKCISLNANELTSFKMSLKFIRIYNS